jgi:DNA-directed RNA polymerase specialized sigma subunit
MDNTTNNSINSPIIDALASYFAEQGYPVKNEVDDIYSPGLISLMDQHAR